MNLDRSLSDVVGLELPDRAAADHLHERLRSGGWVTWTEENHGFWLVGVHLRPSAGDVAALLREVEAWLGDHRLRELWFTLDGRSYLLDPRRRVSTVGTA